MDEGGDNRMPQEPANDVFFFVGSFGLLAALIGSGLIVAMATV
jgi:hypothetical protein